MTKCGMEAQGRIRRSGIGEYPGTELLQEAGAFRGGAEEPWTAQAWTVRRPPFS